MRFGRGCDCARRCHLPLNEASITFCCPECGLLWTMTVHQMAEAIRNRQEMAGKPHDAYQETEAFAGRTLRTS